VIVVATLGLGVAIMPEAAPWFPGAGRVAADASQACDAHVRAGVPASGAVGAHSPGLAIMLAVLGLSLLGDGLRDALDPRMRIS
jgi:peptide/nickel transport system permease protein